MKCVCKVFVESVGDDKAQLVVSMPSTMGPEERACIASAVVTYVVSSGGILKHILSLVEENQVLFTQLLEPAIDNPQ